MSPNDRRFDLVIDRSRDEPVAVRMPPCDVFVTQRLSHRYLATAVNLMRRNGIAVVVDMDDNLDTVAEGNAARSLYHPPTAFGMPVYHSAANVRQACRDATLVTTSTPALAEHYGRPGQVMVLPNYLPDVWFDLPARLDHADVWWPATIDTHPDDPAMVGDAVARLLRAHPQVRFGSVVVPGHNDERCRLAFGLPHPVHPVAPSTPQGWPYLVAQAGIGIAPLTKGTFNAGKCIDSGMRVCTHRGMLKAGDLEVGDYVWRNGWRAVEAVEHDLPRPGVEITTDGGYRLRLTPEHRMLANGEWTYAKDIAVGDTMAMEPEPIGPTDPLAVPWPAESRMSRRAEADHYAYLTAPDGPTIRITPRWGRLLGVYIGDGSVGQGTSIQISCDGRDQDWIDTITSDLQALGLSPMTERITTWDGEVIRRRGVRVASAHLLRVLNALDLTADRPNGRPIRKVRVPEVIWRSPRDVIAEFIAGYFEADGTCNETGIGATSKDEQLIRDLQRLLVTFGIVSRVRSRISRAQNGFEATYWHLTLNRAASDSFADQIGFRSAHKSARLKEITSRPHSNAYRPMNWSPKVTSVEPCMVDPVDIQVEGHEYLAAGFISHNSHVKLIEMMAAGVPWVASPSVEYRRLHARTKVGYLAKTPAEWFARLDALVRSPQLRADQSAAGLEAARGYRLADHAWRWWQAWTQAYQMQSRSSSMTGLSRTQVRTVGLA